MTKTHIRWMIRADMPAVIAMEKESFESPWNRVDFTRVLSNRNCIGMVAERDDEVVGFMVYELHKNQIQVIDFAVAESHRRQGVGSAMVSRLVEKLQPERRNRIMLEVRETNLAGQLFFRSLGFRATAILRDFYDDTAEDAYVFQRRVSQAALV